MATLALSTGEAELGATVRGMAEGEGICAILADFQLDSRLRLPSDASAAVGITQRLGLGRVRHLAVSDLWVQQRVRQGAATVEVKQKVTREQSWSGTNGRSESPAASEPDHHWGRRLSGDSGQLRGGGWAGGLLKDPGGRRQRRQLQVPDWVLGASTYKGAIASAP